MNRYVQFLSLGLRLTKTPKPRDTGWLLSTSTGTHPGWRKGGCRPWHRRSCAAPAWSGILWGSFCFFVVRNGYPPTWVRSPLFFSYSIYETHSVSMFCIIQHYVQAGPPTCGTTFRTLSRSLGLALQSVCIERLSWGWAILHLLGRTRER